ncbi:hypothetical protein KJ359_003431 [Pestalotiopsis sp. 9143b]|nr:hypothetical protein KJ359_003431 [Pestalotiopsis sp. 9143b]
MNHTSGPGDIPDQFTLNEQGNLVCVTPGSIFNGQLGFADGFWFLFLARDSDNAMFFDLYALQNGQEMHLEFDDALGDEGGYPLFRPVTQDHSVFTLNEDGNLFDVTPGLPTNGFEAMSGLIFYMPGNIESIGSDPCVCYIDPNTSRLMANCDGLTKICLYDSGAILTCNETDANSREMFWYALSVDGIPITTSPSSTTTTGPITAPTAITTNPITTPTSTTTTSVHLALPTFVIRDANQTLKLAIYSDPSVEIGGVLRFVPAARPGANDTFAIDAETGHLVYVTPGVHTTGDILYAELNRDFCFDTAVDPEVESEFDHYTPCVCSVNSATSQITCECDGTDKFCLNPSFGIVTPCTDPGIPGQDDVEMFWYAYPPDAPSTTTSTSATATGFPAPQPTFAVRDAAQQNELSLISFPELADYAGYPQFGPVANDRRDGEVPLFTLNGDGNLIYVTPGDTDGYYAYGNAGYPFIFEAHDSGDVAQFMYDLCVCAVAPATSRLSCNCGGAITNCLGSCDAWYAFPV